MLFPSVGAASFAHCQTAPIFLKDPHERKSHGAHPMLERFFGALAIFVFGFDFIWFGCKQNGADNDRNPVWGFLDGFVTFQEYVLGIILFGAIVFAVRHIWDGFGSQRNHNVRAPKRSYDEHPDYDPVPKNRDSWAPPLMPKAPEPHYFMPKETIFKAAPVEDMVPALPKPIPPKPKLTAKELKEKAIKELLGKY